MNIKVNVYSWAALSAYAISNGLIYSWAFWNKFNINILQYVSINDLLPSIIFLITLPLLALIAYVISMHFWNKINKIITDRVFFHIKKAYTPLRPYNIDKILDILSKMASSIALIIVLFIAPNSIKITVAIFMFSYVAYKIIYRKTNILAECGEYRYAVLLILAIAPAVIFVLAEYNADKIIEGNNTYIVSSDSPCISDPKSQYRYIASISDKAFAFSLQDRSVCIFKYDYLKLKHELKRPYAEQIPSNRA